MENFLSILKENYHSIFFYDCLSFYLRNYYKTKKINVKDLYEVYINACEVGNYLSFVEFIEIVVSLNEQYKNLKDLILNQELPDTYFNELTFGKFEEIITDNVFECFYNLIKLEYEKKRKAQLAEIKDSNTNILYLFFNEWIKWEEFEFFNSEENNF